MKKFEEMTEAEILDIKKYLLLMGAGEKEVTFAEFTEAGNAVSDDQVRAFLGEDAR